MYQLSSSVYFWIIHWVYTLWICAFVWYTSIKRILKTDYNWARIYKQFLIQMMILWTRINKYWYKVLRIPWTEFHNETPPHMYILHFSDHVTPIGKMFPWQNKKYKPCFQQILHFWTVLNSAKIIKYFINTV